MLLAHTGLSAWAKGSLYQFKHLSVFSIDVFKLRQMFEIIGHLTPKNQTVIETKAQKLIKNMKLDVSSYAPGRYRIWLFHEANLRNPPTVKKAYFDNFWWRLSQKVYPGCQIGLLTFGDEADSIKSDARISWHRDHSFALPIARGINFGAKAKFGYDFHRQSGQKKTINLDSGDALKFDCKHLHSVISHEPGRFSLILWKVRQDGRYPGLKLCPKIASLLA